MASTPRGVDGGPLISELETRELIAEFFAEGRTLIRAELLQAKAELQLEAKTAATTAKLGAAAAGFAFLGGLSATAFFILLLATIMPAWAAAMVVTGVLVVAAAILGRDAQRELKLLRGPEHTLKAIKEDGEWAKDTMHAAKSHLRANA